MQFKSLGNSLLLVIPTIFCGSCSSADLDKFGTVQISGFRYGLVEFDSQQQARIYKEGNDIPYEVNGMCIAAEEEEPCQWRGFEFSYQSSEEITVFDCVTESDRPQTIVYPHAVVATDNQRFHWGFSVKGRTGRHLRPQYNLPFTGRPLRMTNSCTNNGREVLRWEVTLTPPPVAEAGQ